MNHVNAIRCNDEYQCSHCGKSWDIHEEAPDCKMTFESIAEHKAVNYFGTVLMVPKSHGFIATDRNGSVFSYLREPRKRRLVTKFQSSFSWFRKPSRSGLAGDITQMLIGYVLVIILNGSMIEPVNGNVLT